MFVCKSTVLYDVAAQTMKQQKWEKEIKNKYRVNMHRDGLGACIQVYIHYVQHVGLY